MTREAIEYPRAVNYREEMTQEWILEALAKVVCGYWVGHTMQSVLVECGLAQWGEERGVEVTKKGQQVHYDFQMKGGGERFVFIPSGPYAEEVHRKGE